MLSDLVALHKWICLGKLAARLTLSCGDIIIISDALLQRLQLLTLTLAFYKHQEITYAV